MRALLLLTLLCIVPFFPEAQLNRYVITFTDKGSNPFSLSDPQAYLSQRAIDRRTRYNIAIDSTDLPVTPRYIDSLRASGAVEILSVSKWLNQVAIRTSDAAALAKISSFPFVAASIALAPRTIITNDTRNKFEDPGSGPGFSQRTNDTSADSLPYGYSNGQVKIHNGDFLHRLGFQGNGMQLAVLDAGFYHYLSLPVFDSMRINNQVLGTYDFVDQHESVDEDYYHGMQCLSTIAANLPGSFVGTAPKTSFYLYRTEDVTTEYPIEEHYLASGYERADSVGVDVTSTSLGYALFTDPQFDHSYADMDCNTTIAARAADLGARKGMLMFVSAGNEGNNAWHYIITPGDADSVVTVGAVDTTGAVGSFSSYGPAPDGAIKPSLAAVGWNSIVASVFDGMPTYSSGTSFACPNLAGIGTCLWQAFPERSNMDIFDVMKACASQAEQPDDRVGYGVPDVKKAFVQLLKDGFTFAQNQNACNIQLDVQVKLGNGMTLFLERRSPAENVFTQIQDFSPQTEFAFQTVNFQDNISALPQGVIKYRMGVQIGTDTTFYLDSVQVNYNSPCNPVIGNTIELSPNPVSSQLNLIIENPGSIEYGIVVYNTAGQRVYTESGNQPAGRNLHTINTNRWSQGMYVVVISVDGKKTFTRQIVLKR